MDFDVIVIGSGQAGVPLATRLAASGKRVLLAERGALGGTCVNYGCTPTKTMVASARAAHVARNAGRLGVHATNVTVDFAAVIARKDKIVKQWREGGEKRLRNAGEKLTVVKGHARFVGEHEIEVGGERHRAETIVINVGARPQVPRLSGLDTIDWLDNKRVMELSELPAHLIVLGGGYIGCEFGQMFRRFGAAVTIVDHHDHLLSREDADVSSEIEKVFRAEGVVVELGSGVRAVSKVAEEVKLTLENGREITGSHLLVAAGRRPNTDDLGCDTAGVKLDPQGFIVVDDHYQTSVKGVYAVGDATPQPQFTHTSWDDHRILFDILLGRATRGRAGRIIPYTVFTDPQVAGVGLNEKQASAEKRQVEIATMPFGNIARAIEVDETAGILKLLIDAQTEQIVGAFIVGAEAGELIHVFVALMQGKQTARAIVDAEFVHPTFAEGVQSLVMKLKRYAL